MLPFSSYHLGTTLCHFPSSGSPAEYLRNLATSHDLQNPHSAVLGMCGVCVCSKVPHSVPRLTDDWVTILDLYLGPRNPVPRLCIPIIVPSLTVYCTPNFHGRPDTPSCHVRPI